MFPATRMRRLRMHPRVRDLVRETSLRVDDFILPLFVRHGEGVRNPIASMPGQFQLSVDQLPGVVREIDAAGIPAVILFGIPEHKDATGSDAYCDHGIVQQAIQAIQAESSR
ncbi:MAG: porphobilinogen synthase, partial [Planctomycetaceae bacterium]|nr:porphobilinogen synthase [Planctomycetaceae bacterium]